MPDRGNTRDSIHRGPVWGHPGLGAELHRLRTARGWSLRRLAALVPCNPGYLSRVEHGDRHPTPSLIDALDRVLDARGALIAAANTRPDNRQEPATHRRTVLGLAAAGMAVAGWPLPAGGEVPRRVGMDHVNDIGQATQMYRAWVARHGGAAVRGPVAALLDRAVVMYAAAVRPQVRTGLLAAIADLASLGGYIARDLAAHDEAEAHFRTALSAATAAGATGLGAHTVVRMAGHSLELRQPDRVLELVTLAGTRSVGIDAGGRANQACLRAWGYAQLGDAQAVHRAVGEAEEHYGQRGEGNPAGWAAQHVTEAELYSLTGAAYVDLARRDHTHAGTAIARLSRAIDLRGETVARNRTLDLVSLSEAYLLTGEVNQAGVAALEATQARDGVASTRLTSRIDALRRQLRPFARDSIVAAFLELTH